MSKFELKLTYNQNLELMSIILILIKNKINTQNQWKSPDFMERICFCHTKIQ